MKNTKVPLKADKLTLTDMIIDDNCEYILEERV